MFSFSIFNGSIFECRHIFDISLKSQHFFPREDKNNQKVNGNLNFFFFFYGYNIFQLLSVSMHFSSPKVSTVIFKKLYLLTAKQMIFTHITKLLSHITGIMQPPSLRRHYILGTACWDSHTLSGKAHTQYTRCSFSNHTHRK